MDLVIHYEKVIGIYYFEFEQPKDGNTGAFSFNLSYHSPNSAGGSALIWTEILNSEKNNTLGKAVNFTEATDTLHKCEWTTVPRNITVNEKVETKGSLIGSGTNDNKSYVNGMAFTVTADNSNTGRSEIDDAYANDFIKSFNFTSTLTLPNDFKLDKNIKDAIQNNNYFATSSGEIYAIVDGENVLLATINKESAEKVSLDCRDDNKFIIKYNILNSSSANEIKTDYTYSITYNKGLFYTDKIISNGDSFDFENKIDVVNNYTYSEPKTHFAVATNTITALEAGITVTKSNSSNGYLGGTQSYTININNNSAATYQDLSYVSDTLPKYVYISGENLQKMFLEEYGKKLSVTIENAEIAKHSNEIHNASVQSVSNNPCSITNQNTGWNVPHTGASIEGDNDENVNIGKISIYWHLNKLYVKLEEVNTSNKNSLTNTIDEVNTLDNNSLADILDKIGYFVTKSARYTLKWDFGENYQLYGGTQITFNIYSQGMDTFMMLYYDNNYSYYNEFEKLDKNTAKAYGANNKLLASSKAIGSNTPKSEIYLSHEMFKDGQIVDSNTSLAHNDVIQQTAMFKHYGDGTYGTLPLVNKISSNQQLLIRKDLNKDNESLNSFSTETIDGVEYYILKCDGTQQTLKNIYTNVNELAETINIGSDNILIYWYFDNLPSGEYIKSVDYLTRISIPEDSVKWNISVQSWLNDHQTHRLYLSAGFDGLSLDFDKKIVTNPEQLNINTDSVDNKMDEEAFNKLSDTQILDTFSFVGEDDDVTYLLKFKTSSGSVTIHGKDIYDCLPRYLNCSKNDITMQYFYNKDKVTITSPNNWSVTKDDPSTIAEETNAEYSYIVWDENFQAEMKENSVLYIYVTVSFPKDDLWNTFVNINNGATLYNKFYLRGIVRDVSHELKLPVKARIQKGVYEMGSVYKYYGEDGYISDNLISNQYYTSDDERNYYLNTASKARLVVYYATVYNSGQSKMYLNDMQDLLPKGIKFHSLVNSIDFLKSANYRNRNLITTNAQISNQNTIFNQEKTLATIKDATLVNATVLAEVSDISENFQKVTFNFSKANAITDEAVLKFDDSYEKYYLT